MKKLILTLVCLFVILGCESTPKGPPIPIEQVSIPELNTQTKAYLGENLLMQATGYKADSITLSTFQNVAYRISGGKYCQVRKGSKVFFPLGENNGVQKINFDGKAITTKGSLEYNEINGEVCGGILGCFTAEELNYEHKSNDFCVSSNKLQRVIEYNGKNGDTLNFTYREFTDNIARSAFTTSFFVDLNDGNEFGYKGARFEIINASNNLIEYVVLKNF